VFSALEEHDRILFSALEEHDRIVFSALEEHDSAIANAVKNLYPFSCGKIGRPVILGTILRISIYQVLKFMHGVPCPQLFRKLLKSQKTIL
jgi:hypothetical protein